MTDRLDRRTYDLLRLIDANEPIGSIRLVTLLQQHGYSIKDRTVRLVLSELDDDGLTEKVPGRGRRLTDAGRAELRRGDVSGRLEQIRTRIATLTSQVTYDPLEDVGEVAATGAYVPYDELGDALDAIRPLADTPLGPVLVGVEDASNGDDLACVYFPSSVTLDGVLLSRGINVDLETAGIVEYHPDPPADLVQYENGAQVDTGGAVLRYTDVINGEGSTMDVVSLLVEAGRTSVARAVEGDYPALVVVDNRKFPIARYDEGRDLAVATRDSLGGVIDLRRPRETGPFPYDRPAWNFASLTYGAGEIALALLSERGYAVALETLYGVRPRAALERVSVAASEYGAD